MNREDQSIKEDNKKTQTRLLVPGFIWEMAEVLSHGATKYSPNGWQKASTDRYQDALGRHFLSYMDGTPYDEETGLTHLSHLATNAMFLWFFEEGSSIPTRKCICSRCA